MRDKKYFSEIIGDLSLLYELSLSIGGSLDPRDNCDGFLRTLMSRKNLGFSSVWIRNEYLPGGEKSGAATLIYAWPEFRVRDTTLPISHPIFALLKNREVFTLSSPSDLFAEIITEKGVEEGTFAILKLGDIGVLKLLSITSEIPFDEKELNQLQNVVSKFTISLEGCLSHERVMLEIEERKRIEDALRESEKRYALATIAGMVGVWDWDLETNEIFVDRKLKAFLGYEDHEIRNHIDDWGRLVHPDDIDKVRDESAAHLNGSKPVYEVARRMLHKDGGIRWFLTRGNVIRDADGKPYRMVGTDTDITEQKKAEEALRQSEERFRRFSSAVTDVIYRYDPILNIYDFISPSFELQTGYSLEEIRSDPLRFARKITHAEDADRVQKEFDEYILKGRAAGPLSIRYRVIRKDGRTIWVCERKDFEFTPAGELFRINGVVRDVTEQVLAEELQKKLETQVQRSQKLESLGVLAGGIAHDFNNLLSGILGNTDLALLRLPPDAPARANVQKIQLAAQRAAELSHQMLAYSGKGKFMIEPLSLSKLISEMAPLLEVASTGKVILDYDIPADLPAIEADATQIRQVLLNLVTNATEALPEKGGQISLSTFAMECDRAYLSGTYVDDDLPEGAYVCLEVTDAGAGMSQETQKRIFEPFFSTKFVGRGLGLGVVLGIVRGHRGAIRVSSEPGRGSVFTVLFPSSDKPYRTSSKSKSKLQDWVGSGTVLLVDDAETVIDVGKHMLEEIGFHVLTASNGPEAIDAFNKHSDEINLVILDMTMPIMSGSEVFSAIRGIRNDIRVVLSSGYDEQEAAKQFDEKQLAGFIHKPYKLSTLTEITRQALGE